MIGHRAISSFEIAVEIAQADLTPKFYPVLSSLQLDFEVFPVFSSPRAGPFGVGGSGAEAADEPFMSEIGGLLPIALWGADGIVVLMTCHG